MNGFCAGSRLPRLVRHKLPAILFQVTAVVALSCGSITFGDDERANAGAEEAHIRRARLSALRVKHCLFINGDEFYIELEYADATPDEVEEPGAVTSQWQTIRFSKHAFDLAMFGNRDSALTRLEIILQREVRAVAQIAELNEEQLRKLILAGRGDIHRLLHRVESQRHRFEGKLTVRNVEAQDAVAEIFKSMDEAASLRKEVAEGPFGIDSLLEKNVRRMLTKSEYARRLEERQKANEFRSPPKKRFGHRQGFQLDVF